MALFTWYQFDNLSTRSDGNLSIHKEFDIQEGNEAWVLKVEDKSQRILNK